MDRLKNSPHLYPKTQGFEGVFERRLYSLFTKRVSTKHLALTYIHKNGSLAPLEKNIPHLYE